jgi:hypothetical protein
MAASIPSGYFKFEYVGSSALDISAQAWASYVDYIIDVRSDHAGLSSFRKGSTINSLTQLVSNQLYFGRANTAFSMADANLAHVGGTTTTPTNPATTTFDFTTSSAAFALTLWDDQKNGYRERSVLDYVEWQTEATSLNLETVNTWDQGVALFVGGAYQGVVRAGLVLLTGSGTRTVRLVELSQNRVGDQVGTEKIGTWITKVTFSAPATLLTHIPTSVRDSISGDSITALAGATEGATTSYAALLRNYEGHDLALDAHGYRTWTLSLGSAQQQVDGLARDQRYFNGASVKRKLWALGTNDAPIAGSSAATITAIAGQNVDRYYKADPSIIQYLFTPLYRRDLGLQTATVNALKALKTNGARPWLIIVDRSTWLSDAHISGDNIHPNDTGHAIDAGFLRDTLAGLATPGNAAGTGWVPPATTPTNPQPTITQYAPAGRYEENSAYLVKSGSPTAGSGSNFSNGSGLTLAVGDRVSIGFTGIQLKYYAPTYNTIGRIRVTIDGVYYYFDGGGSTQNSSLRFTSPVLPAGNHIATYELDPDNPGNGGCFYDAVEIVDGQQALQYAPAGYYEESSAYVFYTGGSAPAEPGSNYSGGYGTRFGVGTKACIAFTGTQLKYYAPKYSSIGRIKVTIDNQVYYFDGGGTTSNSGLVFTSPVLPYGNHLATYELDPDNFGNGGCYYDAVEVI